MSSNKVFKMTEAPKAGVVEAFPPREFVNPKERCTDQNDLYISVVKGEFRKAYRNTKSPAKVLDKLERYAAQLSKDL